MPAGTGTEIFDTAGDPPSGTGTPAVDITAAFAEQSRSWSSALFPPKSKPSTDEPEGTAAARSPVAEPPLPGSPRHIQFKSKPQDRDLFVRRTGSQRPQ